MPLMVDPSNGQLFAQNAVVSAPASAAGSVATPNPVSVFQLGSAMSPSSNTLIAAMSDTAEVVAASDTIATGSQGVATQAASSSKSVAQAGASSSVNMTDIIAKQTADQMERDAHTPGYLLLALLILLSVFILIGHPRFLSRLFATRLGKNQDDRDALGSRPRKAGGGDLDKGWILRKGEKVIEDDGSTWRSDPFKDPAYATFARPTSFLAPRPTKKTTPMPTQVPPPHITPLLQTLPFASALLIAPFCRLPSRFGATLRIPQIVFIFIYFAITAFAVIWKSNVEVSVPESGYGHDWTRTGLVAMTQIPVVIALGVRGGFIGLSVGMGYERLKVFHKIVGRAIFLCATIHMGFYLHKFLLKGSPFASPTRTFIGGFTAWLAVVVIAVTSTPWFRQTFYNVFKICHVLGITGLLAGLGVHVPVAKPWCIAAAGIYGISVLFSAAKTRFSTAEFTALNNETTVVSMPGLTSGWRAGQHVRIRVPALGPESHPFTIASAPGGEGMVLMCKVAGGWTRRLHHYASDVDEEKRNKSCLVVLEGPYGGLGNTLLPSFSGVLLVAGGSGITHSLTLAHDLVLRASTGVVRARTVDLVWVVRTEEAAKPILPTLLDLVNDAKKQEEDCLDSRTSAAPVALRVKLHVTKCRSPDEIKLLPTNSHPYRPYQEKYYGKVSSNKVLSSIVGCEGRPHFPSIIEDLTDEVIDRGSRQRTDPSGVCVTACGPVSMVNGVRDAVRGIEGWKRRGVGGIELEEEHFGF